MQSRRLSLIEVVANVFTGFFVSMCVWQLIAAPLFGYEVTIADNFALTSIFTVTSITRGYLFRRLFNWFTVKALKEDP